MAYSAEIKRKLRENYIKGMPLTSAASALTVPYETARNWKRKAELAGDDWDNVRAAHSVSKSGVKALTAAIIEDFVLMFKATIDQVKENTEIKPLEKAQVIAQLSDSYAKTIKAAGDSNPKLSALAVAMEVLKKMAEFIREHYPHLIESYAEILEPFGEEISRTYG